MQQSKEPSLLVKTVRCSVSENNCRHPFWPRFNVSIICTLCIDVLETNKLLVELGHILEYNLATNHWMASNPSVHSGPLHTYPDIIESTTSSLRNSKISTSTHIRIHCITQDSSWNIGNRACVVKTGKSRVKSKKENLGTRLPS